MKAIGKRIRSLASSAPSFERMSGRKLDAMALLGALGLAGSVGAALTACQSRVGEESLDVLRDPLILGKDDRSEVFGYSDADWAARSAEFTVALVESSRVDASDPDAVRFDAPTLGERLGLCPDERFVDQPSIAFCSGALIAPDLVLTAGHCVRDQADCSSTRLVFDLYYAAPATPAPVTAAEVFSCQSIVVREEAAADYAILRLDREVSAREPAKLSFAANPLATGAPLVISGYPSGVPQKIANGAWVQEPLGDMRQFFVANLDAFPGNSGSGVFLKGTDELVGILVRGAGADYIPDVTGECYRARSIRDAEIYQAPHSTYAFRALEALCTQTPDARLCHCGDGICEAGVRETTASCPGDCGSACGDGACNGAEDATSCYADCGVCGDQICEPEEERAGTCCRDCGCAAGSSCVADACELWPGNVNGDERVDELDAAATDDVVRGRPVASFFQAAADVDCNGRVDEADVLLIAQRGYDIIARTPCERVTGISGGNDHICFLFGSGGVRCAGEAYYAQLGYADVKNRGATEPLAALGYVPVGGRVEQLVSGGRMNCALLAGGAVRCWGANWDGELGYGHKEFIGDDEPAGASGDLQLGGPVLRLAAGWRHVCALLDDGRVRCWGDNSSGQLGYGHTRFIGDDEPPASAGDVVLGGRAREITAGDAHTCALLEGGAVRCWGYGFNGALGYGSTESIGDDETPASAGDVPIGEAVKSVVAGAAHTCVLLSDGRVKCWGTSWDGRLCWGADRVYDGDEPAELPALLPAVDLGAAATQVVAGGVHTCALSTNGAVRCWGDGRLGQLGYGNQDYIGDDEPPAAAGDVPVGVRLVNLSSTRNNTCGTLESGDVRCWGYNYWGQIGLGRAGWDWAWIGIAPDNTPERVGDVPAVYPLSPVRELVNPYGLEVWLTDQGSNSQSSALALYVANRGHVPVSGFKARYLFSVLEARDKPVGLQDNYTPWSTPRLATVSTYSRSLEFDFAGRTLNPGQSTSQGQWAGEMVRIHYTDWSAVWDRRNDYSAVEMPPAGAWKPTDHVRIYGADGELIYGWRQLP